MAMWVALTQCLAGRTFLLVHPAYASSWNTEMVSLVAGLEGVILVTVDICALGMADVEGRLHRKTTTNMTNAQVVADVFRPYRCTRDHEHAPSVGAWRTRRDQEYPRQHSEVLVTGVKASLLHPDRREPGKSMTLAVREDDEPADDGRYEDSGLDDDDAPTDDLRPTEGQIKMLDQYHRNLGHPSRRKFLKVLRRLQCSSTSDADIDAQTPTRTQSPNFSRKAAVTRTYEFNRIVAMDVFHTHLRGQSRLVLNNICHGTNFQVSACMRPDGTPTAAVVRSTFQRSWRRYFGTPDVKITDGGSQFRGDFAQSGEHAGIPEVIVDADAP